MRLRLRVTNAEKREKLKTFNAVLAEWRKQMYCVKCGVELADSERKCPLCSTPVYFPGLPENPDRPYPEYVKTKDEMSPRGIMFIISVLFGIALIICLVCDLSLNSGINWSGYVIGGLVVAYTVMILPGWFKRPSPAVFAPVNFLAIALLLLYVDLTLGGGWFLPFALPIVAGAALIMCSVLILIYYLRMGYLYIFGGASIAVGVFSVLIEYLIHLNFSPVHRLYWSIFPLISLFLIGMMLIIIAIVRPFRESLKKIFAL